MMKDNLPAWFWVGLGGGLGAILRYLVGNLSLAKNTEFPVKTLVINVCGALLIGYFSQVLGVKFPQQKWLPLFLQVGLCGGFTTFSTFALETHNLLQTSRPLLALTYSLLSLTFSVLAVYLGIWLGQMHP